MVGSDGAELSYYGCTVSIPQNALEEETEISLEILNTDFPGLAVSPVLKLEPSNLRFHFPVTVTLPLVICPSHPTLSEPQSPELILMCCTNGKWSKLQSTKFRFGDLRSFECRHFSAYCWIYDKDGTKIGLKKRLACCLFKGLPNVNESEVNVCICDDLPHVIEVHIPHIPMLLLIQIGQDSGNLHGYCISL